MITWYKSTEMVCVVLAILGGLPLSSSPAFGQQTLWETYSRDAMKAYEAGRYTDAAQLFRLAVAEAEKSGSSDPRLATSLNNLGELYRVLGKYDQAEPLYKRALAINERPLGPDHPEMAGVLENYATLLAATNRQAEADKLQHRADVIRKANE